MELGFAALMKPGLAPDKAASSLLIVDGYVRSHVQLALQYSAPGATDTWPDQLRTVIDPDQFPAVHAVLVSGAFDDGGGTFPSDEFEFGLALLLDGVERLVVR